jgi:CheY-like chemotaxis protein
MQVLVVDHHPISRRFLANMLRQWNIDVHEAADGKGAMEAAIRAGRTGRPYDFVFLDDGLPDSTAYPLVTLLRDRIDLRVGALVVIGSIIKQGKSDEVAEGMVLSRLIKPVKQSELLAIVGTAPGQARGGLSSVPVTTTLVRAQRSLQVLLVEDNLINQRVAQQTLIRAGHRVVIADHAAAALTEHNRERFDLILMDLQMPGMDGVEATGVIRQRERETGERVVIIALTAHVMPHHRERCLLAGMDGYLIKPIRPVDLLEALARVETTAVVVEIPRSPAGPVLDRESLIERVFGDRQVLAEITEIFLDSGRRLMAEAAAALVRGEAKRFEYVIHTLAGMFRSLSAVAAMSVAVDLEAAVVAGEWKPLAAGFARLEREVELLRIELENLSNEEPALVPAELFDAVPCHVERHQAPLVFN